MKGRKCGQANAKGHPLWEGHPPWEIGAGLNRFLAALGMTRKEGIARKE